MRRGTCQGVVQLPPGLLRGFPPVAVCGREPDVVLAALSRRQPDMGSGIASARIVSLDALDEPSSLTRGSGHSKHCTE